MSKRDLEKEIYLLELESIETIEELEKKETKDGGETVLPL